MPASGPVSAASAMMLEAVAQPLDRGAGDEDRAFHRVRRSSPSSDQATVVSRPSTGSGSVGADVREHERTGAVRVLRHARLDARLAEQRGLLVAGDAAHRHREPGRAVRTRRAEPAADGATSGRHAARHAEQVAQLVGPLAARRCRRASCGSRSTGRSRARRRRPAGEAPQDPRVDGAEREVGVGRRRRRRASSHSSFVAEKYGSRTSPVASRIGGSWPASRSASQRGAVRRSCHTIARWRGRPVRAVPHDRRSRAGS